MEGLWQPYAACMDFVWSVVAGRGCGIRPSVPLSLGAGAMFGAGRTNTWSGVLLVMKKSGLGHRQRR
jgi:hypothetical protein